MAKDVIKIKGENIVVTEGTARAYRGTWWALTTVVVWLVITLVLLIASFCVSISK